MRAFYLALLIESVFVAATAGFAPALVQTRQTKISLTTSQTPASIPAIPTADIARAMEKKCPNLSLTRNAEKADYTLEAVGGDRTNPHGQRLYKFTLFDHDGNVAFTTETRRMDNAVKDVCAFINKKVE